ncbi:MAG: hypothetical protein LBG92_02865 [Prevotellaceae bacterium]|jgi:nitrogen regulatory protein PII|nr:hypothetical protein [Prevotellaceae bacterium]
MKRVFILALLSAAILSCGGGSGSKKAGTTGKNEAANSSTSEVAVYELDKLLAVADSEVEKTVKVIGTVTHTCKHSGKRCFIVGESQQASMRVEAKGEIGGFNRELVGSKLEITGVLKERRLTKEAIDKMEKDVEAKKQEDGSEESCAAELSSIADMRKWMKEHDKDYYVIYFMDGTNYNTLD